MEESRRGMADACWICKMHRRVASDCRESKSHHKTTHPTNGQQVLGRAEIVWYLFCCTCRSSFLLPLLYSLGFPRPCTRFDSIRRPLSLFFLFPLHGQAPRRLPLKFHLVKKESKKARAKLLAFYSTNTLSHRPSDSPREERGKKSKVTLGVEPSSREHVCAYGEATAENQRPTS